MVYNDKRLMVLFEDSPIAVYTCDAEGYITFFNEAAAKLWGRRPQINQDLWCGSSKVYYPDGTAMPLKASPMAMALHSSKPLNGVEMIIERPDRTQHSVLVYPRPIFDADDVLIGGHNTVIDITSQKKSEANQAMLASIITSSDDAIISKNLQGIITSWNDTATQMFGYTPEEVIGKSIKLLIPEDRHSEEDDILYRISNDERVRHYETERLTKAGKLIKISLTISPIKNQNGTIIGASKIARNITEEIAIRLKLKKYMNELEALNKHKDDFMNLASHELKTPLTSAKAYLQLLDRFIEKDHRGYEFVKRAVVSISRLEKLVNDLLDISKIKTGQLQYNMEMLNFNEIIKNSMDSVKHLSNTHSIVLKNMTDVTLYGDRVRLEQVLNNFLSNAIKYSPNADRIEIEANREADMLVVSVKDFGIGIPQDSIDRLGERYYRVEDNSSEFPGLGVGLFVSAEILSRHNGKLMIESEVNKGSTFKFSLPIVKGS